MTLGACEPPLASAQRRRTIRRHRRSGEPNAAVDVGEINRRVQHFSFEIRPDPVRVGVRGRSPPSRNIAVGSYTGNALREALRGRATARRCTDHGRVREARRSVVTSRAIKIAATRRARAPTADDSRQIHSRVHELLDRVPFLEHRPSDAKRYGGHRRSGEPLQAIDVGEIKLRVVPPSDPHQDQTKPGSEPVFVVAPLQVETSRSVHTRAPRFAKLCGGRATARRCTDHVRVREVRRSVVTSRAIKIAATRRARASTGR